MLSSEMSVLRRATRRHILEDDILLTDSVTRFMIPNYFGSTTENSVYDSVSVPGTDAINVSGIHHRELHTLKGHYRYKYKSEKLKHCVSNDTSIDLHLLLQIHRCKHTHTHTHTKNTADITLN
jgi:hypothetical protein